MHQDAILLEKEREEITNNVTLCHRCLVTVICDIAFVWKGVIDISLTESEQKIHEKSITENGC